MRFALGLRCETTTRFSPEETEVAHEPPAAYSPLPLASLNGEYSFETDALASRSPAIGGHGGSQQLAFLQALPRISGFS
jgi:hypothetical protein